MRDITLGNTNPSHKELSSLLVQRLHIFPVARPHETTYIIPFRRRRAGLIGTKFKKRPARSLETVVIRI